MRWTTCDERNIYLLHRRALISSPPTENSSVPAAAWCVDFCLQEHDSSRPTDEPLWNFQDVLRLMFFKKEHWSRVFSDTRKQIITPSLKRLKIINCVMFLHPCSKLRLRTRWRSADRRMLDLCRWRWCGQIRQKEGRCLFSSEIQDLIKARHSDPTDLHQTTVYAWSGLIQIKRPIRQQRGGRGGGPTRQNNKIHESVRISEPTVCKKI